MRRLGTRQLQGGRVARSVIEAPEAPSVIRTTVRRVIEARGYRMWAQLITVRLKPGKEGDLPRLVEQLQATEQPGSGLLRSSLMQEQTDPSRVHMLVVLESEEKAHEPRERSATYRGTADRQGHDGGDLRRRSGVHRSDRRCGLDAINAGSHHGRGVAAHLLLPVLIALLQYESGSRAGWAAPRGSRGCYLRALAVGAGQIAGDP